MNLRVSDTFQVPLTTLLLVNSIVVMLLVPLFDRGLFPLLRRKNINFSPLRRIGTGLFLANLAIIYAGGLEVYRLSFVKHGNTILQKVGDKFVTASNLSIFIQVPCFIIFGASEVLVAVAGLEFASDEAPPTMRSMVQSIFLLTASLGNYLGGFLVFLVNLASWEKPWISDDLNESHIDLYFFTLGTLGFIGLFIFMFIADKYQSKISGGVSAVNRQDQ